VLLWLLCFVCGGNFVDRYKIKLQTKLNSQKINLVHSLTAVTHTHTLLYTHIHTVHPQAQHKKHLLLGRRKGKKKIRKEKRKKRNRNVSKVKRPPGQKATQSLSIIAMSFCGQYTHTHSQTETHTHSH